MKYHPHIQVLYYNITGLKEQRTLAYNIFSFFQFRICIHAEFV